MARRNRLLFPNYPHHIVHRGHNRAAVFDTDADRRIYLANLARLKSQFDVKVYSYCLMTNHVHLILEPPDNIRNLSRLMKRLAGRHAGRRNALRQRTGSVWEGRFRCSPIERDRYLLACSRYVELNPVRAGMVTRPEDYPWSSLRARLGWVVCRWLDWDPCFLAMGSTPDGRRGRYIEFLRQGTAAAELSMIRASIRANDATASEAWRRNPLHPCPAKRPRGRPPRGTGNSLELFSDGNPGGSPPLQPK